MKNLISLVMAVEFFIVGCAPFTPQSLIDGHKDKREALLDGDVDDNMKIAIEGLAKCYGKSGAKTINFVPGMGVVSSVSYFDVKIDGGDDFKSIIFGNSVKGGTGYLKFFDYENKTKLFAYSKAWYSVDIKLFNKYVDLIISRDISDCSIW
ncbi:hypothetical protein [Marinobacterium lacunae]|uniref:hypothetical protein n=1 Tax=Marinobacterium lacunae TaxID=1232683 RepID=UPI000564C011|nr:hypothetical protein [Marinobacterium lacunae]